MAFNPQALSERTLKQFVDRTLSWHKQHNTTSQTPPKRSQVQEEVACMLGFLSWHQAISSVKNNPDIDRDLQKEKSSSSFLYPQEGVEHSKENTLKLLEWFQSQGGTDVVLQTNKKAVGCAYGKNHFLTKRIFDNEDLSSLLCDLYGNPTPITTGDGAFAYKTNNTRFHVIYQRLRGGDSLGWEVAFQMVPQIPPHIDNFLLPSSLLTRLKNSKNRGLVVVSSSPSDVKDGLLQALTRMAIEEEEHKKFVVLDPASEMDYECVNQKGSNIISQNDMRGAGYVDGIRHAMRRKASHIFVAEARDKETLDEIFKASLSGHKVYTSMISRGCANAVRRVINCFDVSERHTATIDFISSLDTLVSLKQVPGINDTLVVICEFLVMDRQGVTVDRLMSVGQDNLLLEIEKIIEEQQSGFEHDAKKKFAEGLISEKVLNDVLRQKHR